MQLLFRTIIIIAIGLLLLGATSLLMQQKLEDSFGNQVISSQTQKWQYIWENFLRNESAEIIKTADFLHHDTSIKQFVQGQDFLSLNNFLEEKMTSIKEGFNIAILNNDKDIIYSSEDRLNVRVPVPETVFAEILSGEKSRLSGLGYNDRQELLHSVIVPIKQLGMIIGVAVYSQKMDGVFAEFQNFTGADIFLVNRYYRIVAGKNDTLWEQFSPYFENSDIDGLYTVKSDNGKSYRLIKFPITGMLGSLQAFGVSMSDVSKEAGGWQDLKFILNFIFVLLGLFIIAAVVFILRSSFRPLKEGSGHLLSIANSENISSLGNEFDDDEIGKILNAIETLRLRNIHLDRLQRSRSKQRQRVHGLLLSEMSELANNLDDDAKQEIMDDLEDIKEQILGKKAEDSHGDDVISEQEADKQDDSGNELVTVASAFRKLAFRVTRKQQHLNQVIADLEESLKTEVAYFALQKELNLAHEVQLSFIPDTGLEIGNLEMRGFMQPAKTVGGDLFDYFVIDDEHIGFCVGDVSDKGVPAALFMMVARIVLWLVARREPSVGNALAQVNNAIHSNNPNNFFVSIFYGRMNIKTGHVDYACAGHPPAILIREGATRAVELETANDLVVGIFPDVEYAEFSVTMNSGDNLFVYSDGISEAMNSEDAQYSPEHLLDMLSTHRCHSVEEMIDLVIKDVERWSDGCDQSDDITCLALRYR